MRRTWPLAFVLGCGIDAVGAMATDGGASSSSSSSSSSSGDVPADAGDHPDGAAPDTGPPLPGTFCGDLQGDPTVKLCLDFDSPAQMTTPFGFAGLLQPADSTFTIVPAADGGALVVSLAEGFGSRSARGYRDVLPGVLPFPATHLVMDADIVVHARTNAPALLTLDVLGQNCAQFIGIGAGGDGVFATSTPAAPSTTVPLEQPFHVKVELDVTPGLMGNRKVTIDGTVLTTAGVYYDVTCDYVGISAGTYFTGTQQGSASATFDRIVVRKQ